MIKESDAMRYYLSSELNWAKLFSERVELVIGTIDALNPDGGEEWIISGDDLATVMTHLYEVSDTIKKSMDDAMDSGMDSGMTDPLLQWFADNHDLIVDEAWKHFWMELFSG
tara:strand:- start:602 stop:937 length:336 start_codon:yes stop_codon:yes gene_type:complete